MNSMTGFGRAQTTRDHLSVTIEINSVNRRNLEIGFSLPREWQAMERDLNECFKGKIHRGKVYATLQVSSAESHEGIQWDSNAVNDTLERLEKLAQQIGSPWPPDTDTLLRVISLHKNEFQLEPYEDAIEWILPLFNEALKEFNGLRSAEGARLKNDLLERLDNLISLRNTILELSQNSVPRYREMLFQRLQSSGLEIDLTDERVLKEIAIFADKCDISEELTRLGSHFEELQNTLSSDRGEPIGRKLEFILQEVNREFNTVGSKANQFEVNRAVIEAKNELERIREQIQNVE